MGQFGFFDLNRSYEGLDEKSDPLVAIAAMVPFKSFRPKLNAALIKGELRRSEAERKPWDVVGTFKALVLFQITVALLRSSWQRGRDNVKASEY